MDKKVWALLGVALVIGLVGAFMVVALTSSQDSSKDNVSDSNAAKINNVELNVGDEAPDFRLPDHKGGYVRLSDLRGKSNVILAFYPAAFTPV